MRTPCARCCVPLARRRRCSGRLSRAGTSASPPPAWRPSTTRPRMTRRARGLVEDCEVPTGSSWPPPPLPRPSCPPVAPPQRFFCALEPLHRQPGPHHRPGTTRPVGVARLRRNTAMRPPTLRATSQMIPQAMKPLVAALMIPVPRRRLRHPRHRAYCIHRYVTSQSLGESSGNRGRSSAGSMLQIEFRIEDMSTVPILCTVTVQYR
mmetsp:Transcript_5782/g.14199  ORF Transcript_5782/g.14199 Transcript_5782/m.14199 type:complete len:207 (-) Transcript_5782:77-697(-)